MRLPGQGAALVAGALLAAVAIPALADPAPGVATNAATAAEAAPVAEPDSYRSPPYSGPVPASLAGARVITPAEALALHAAGTPFIDVYKRTTRPADLPEGTLWREPVHDTIPGAIWAPGTGYDRLSPQEDTRLRAALAAATDGDPANPVVVFCRRDCWLSWNAARRAVGFGYSAVLWFPAGADGWQEAGGALVPAATPRDQAAQSGGG